MALFQPLLTILLTRSYELMIVVIMTVVGLGMITFMAHKEKNRVVLKLQLYKKIQIRRYKKYVQFKNV